MEDLFPGRWLALDYELLRNDPLAFMDRLARFMQATYEVGKINRRPAHRSYGDKALRAFLGCGRIVNPAPPRRGAFLTWLKRRGRMVGCTTFLRVAAHVPEKWIRIKTLIPEADLASIRDRYAEDWSSCQAACRRTPMGSVAS